MSCLNSPWSKMIALFLFVLFNIYSLCSSKAGFSKRWAKDYSKISCQQGVVKKIAKTTTIIVGIPTPFALTSSSKTDARCSNCRQLFIQFVNQIINHPPQNTRKKNESIAWQGCCFERTWIEEPTSDLQLLQDKWDKRGGECCSGSPRFQIEVLFIWH